MQIKIFKTPQLLGKKAADSAANIIAQSLKQNGNANIILATGTSQYETLGGLVEKNDISWDQVTVFHLDEYLGMKADHPASFRRYLKERFRDHIPNLGVFHEINGEVPDPQKECNRLSELIRHKSIDLALIGIGENAHLAFNDPPADFNVSDPYIVVDLDPACRRQQLNEGWFPNLDSVPQKAISMSISQIMRSKHLIVSVPDVRKAQAVKCAVTGPIDPDCPASILQQHPSCELLLDINSSSLL